MPNRNVFAWPLLSVLSLAGLALPLLPDAVSGMADHVVRQSLNFIRA